MKKLYIALMAIILTIPLFAQNTGVTVIAPNGGENWITGCPYTIQWIVAAPVPVKIELFSNGVFYMTICSQVPANTNSYVWTPPYSVTPANTYKVKITTLTTTVPYYDFSNNNFSIALGTITVASPNGGEIWMKGTTHQILWTDNICENVRIELWKGGVFNSLIAASTPSTGLFTWIIPNITTLIPGNDFKVKIIGLGLNSGTTSLINDFSDGNFTIAEQGIIVIVPNGGELWYTGGTYTISWIDNVPENVRIELWKGGVFQYVISPSASGPYSWTITAATVAGTDYKVKVIALTSAANKFDFSDNNFSISSGCFITVTSPNGGETWVKGSTHIITWLDNITYNVRIELWKGGIFNSLINASAPSTGSCYWAIPATQQSGSDYKVRISALSNTGTVTCLDFSDNNFSIVGSNITPTAYKLAGSEMKIYPNPCNDILQVNLGDLSVLPVSLEIMNITGKLTLRHDIESSSNDGITLNTSGLSDGYYLFIIRKGSEVIFRNSLIVKH